MELKKPRINLPTQGDDARSLQGQPGGPVQINEGVTPEEASGAPRSELSKGPKVLENGAYAPARYELRPGVICEDR